MKRSKPLVFVVDDNDFTLIQIKRNLEKSFPCEVKTFTKATDVIHSLDMNPDFVLSDYQLTTAGENGLNGEQLLIILKEKRPDLPVMMYSSRNSITLAVRLMKNGASDFINSDSARHSDHFAYLLAKRLRQERDRLHRKMLEKQVTVVAIVIAIVFVTSIILVSATKPDMLPYIVLGFGLLFGSLLFVGRPSIYNEIRGKRTDNRKQLE